jgi:uncharacterized membrane protein YfcA
VPSPIIQDLAIFGAGIAAGMINVVVGSGTLITFPTLLAFNFPPVLANVSNNVGLIPGSLTGAWGYRAELTGQRDRALKLGSASLGGGIVGAILLLVLPAGAFEAIVPVLIGIALVMVILQPQLSKWVARRQRASVQAGAAALDASSSENLQRTGSGGWVLWFLVFCTGIYGGYFGAAQGVLLLGLLGVVLGDTMQRVNAVKNILAALVNGVAAIVFIIVSHVDWTVAGIIAVGSVLGGLIGARVGRKLSPWGLRIVIICVGIAALVKLLI